ncbi:MAG: hypothetical protein LKM31_00165 [Sphingobium sp.]|jgi:hypothetical protein|uniref:hypothetical protein n=1 Tax=Sphingobium sp. JS3065 TaxID=2970925 RepID=UPI00226533D9|nr:hypothetical protein [Sphingobium sp. JS3065]MCI1271488.1 hypothetical protein [Sphingobium sp.]MCI1754359.1 hypothetical protein [Sphingobium sp.]MCI2053943.1 hypothetical protein [Sphingobium sp.]UZW56693.1 hypothetical protein NUH86_08080 [Sphingobium sp. JS3065]
MFVAPTEIGPALKQVPRRLRSSGASLAVAALIILSAAGCSSQAPSSNPHDEDHFAGTNPQIIGRHIYGCDDGAQITVDFLADGLTIEVRSTAGGKPVRLSAPGQGLQYIGDRITADATGGQMTINRQGHPAQACRRI